MSRLDRQKIVSKEAFKCGRLGEKYKPLRMKLYGSTILLALLMVTTSAAQGQSTTCTSTFFSALVQLIPCRAAVAPFSPIPPSAACCNSLRALGQPCLCVLVNGPPISGVDRNMVLQLPEKCTASFDPCDIMA
ncbi:hypothetical protein L6164_018007 [Bauhinia variegata]|uniref:Uncharacterized protein n=1 Tax=Bauhinia variegata TaxID=167791 RepID=A0ACB9NAW3_BAUVA|nr:hypothetical protein L6164_018007 [Bauhinia variegata]